MTTVILKFDVSDIENMNIFNNLYTEITGALSTNPTLLERNVLLEGYIATVIAGILTDLGHRVVTITTSRVTGLRSFVDAFQAIGLQVREHLTLNQIYTIIPIISGTSLEIVINSTKETAC